MMALRAERSAWVAGGVGLLGSGIVWVVSPALFPHAWLAALTFWLGWPLGSMALLFIHALTGGRWGSAIRPQLASGVATLPLLLPAMLPILFVLHTLYPWMHADVAAHLDNRFYLNAPFFYAMSVVYLIVWLGLAIVVLYALRQEHPEPLMYRMAPPGLILLALTVTFAAIDFTLSLDPRFASSIYGLLVASEAVLLALSIAVLGVTFARQRDNRESTHDLGRLLFGLLVLWAYLDFMQILIVWNSDLPDEANWYLPRLVGGWAGVAIFIAAVHFLLPFFALIWPQVQRSRRALSALAALLVATEVPRAWWLVIPAAGRPLSALDAIPMVAILGLATGMALRASRSAWLMPAVAAHG
jgi:hypothetical protein